MSVAPGSILGWMATRDLLRSRNADSGSFLDAGCGEGWWTAQLMKLGFLKGTAVEPSMEAITRARDQFDQLAETRVRLLNCNLSELEQGPMFDLGCAFTVLEHLENDVKYLRDLVRHVRSGGWVIVTVPSREDKWTLEDDLVGQLRRYTRKSLRDVMLAGGCSKQLEIIGVGFPLLNLTENVRNALLKRKRSERLHLSRSQQTAVSGVWDIKWYNTFPAILRMLINEVSFKPFHWMQKRFMNFQACVMLIAIAQVE